MEETWKPVPGYAGLYEVSDRGNVRSLARSRHTVQGLQRWHGRMLRRFTDNTGYWYVNLSNGRAAKKTAVHRIVLLAFVGPPPDGYQACHGDGDRKNACLANLRWDSPVSNAADRVLHGTNLDGERNPHAKLTADQVDEIRSRSESSLSLAPIYGVASSTIRAIRLRTNWRHQ
ncbi:NUMOD4 domain-containing protein [Achromobacter ruhlandii]|uniref:NUMOD4 domain-containing protein n=1 Tax=Achromobacter ruhlandii TaxID=72557 RepID=UPI001EEE3593|nr:NUMOD4 domain-containing protein [Achromobacter ruhlandii]